jgi:hypothetical protein
VADGSQEESVDDETNPYASPRTVHQNSESSEIESDRPLLTRLATFGLMMNAICAPCLFLFDYLADHGRRLLTVPLAVKSLEVGLVFCGIWTVLVVPITSMFAAYRSYFPDRYTKWWRRKAIVAVLMFLAWLIGLILVVVTSG